MSAAAAAELERQDSPGADGETGLPRLLAGLGEDGWPVPLSRHRHLYPAPPRLGRRHDDLLVAVERSGLTGRGGAGFPTGRKMRAVSAGRRRPVVVVNGSEGEPTSRKDTLLLRAAPHLVLDGAVLAAAAIGTREVVVAVDRKATKALQSMEWAVGQRRSAEPGPSVRVVALPHRYVAGEESALVHWINGGPAKPTLTPPRPFESGVDARPTLVDNVETLAHLAQVVRWGPDWFREVGTAAEPGTMLVTMSGAIDRPGVYEVPLGGRLSEVVRAAGGSPSRMEAVLIGGYFGSWLDGAKARRARLSNEHLRPLGSGLGCGAIVVLPQEACGLHETARILDWLAGETAGQCGSCVHGLAAIAGATAAVSRGAGSDATVESLHRWATQIEGRGACRFPDGAVRLLRSALNVFGDDVERHLRGEACATGPSVLPIPTTKGQPWR